MTREDSHLLFEDLSARLPYEVWVKHPEDEQPVLLVALGKVGSYLTCRVMPNSTHTQYGLAAYDIAPSIEFVKPYLRPLSSMTNEEKKEYLLLSENLIDDWEVKPESCSYFMQKLNKWLLIHHFDINGLIPKGLALKAPDDMY